MNTLSFYKTTVTAAVLMGLSGAVMAKNTVPVVSTNVTEAEVLAAQQAWGNALVQIAQDFEKGGFDKAKQTANAVLDAAYGYNMGEPIAASMPDRLIDDLSALLELQAA